MDSLAHILEMHHLLKPDAERLRPGASLLEWCDAGALVGGLSIARDVRPDECLGPLLLAIGGSAAQVRVLDVREGKDALALTLLLAEREVTWRVRDILGLVEQANRAFAKDNNARFVWELGDWQERLQLWCIAKQLRTKLQRALAVP